MPKTRQQKEQIAQELETKLTGAKSIIIANQEGLTVEQSQELREKCKQENVEFIAVKKTLLSLAIKNAGLGEIEAQKMQGSLGVAISQDDEVAPAKILKDFAKNYKQVTFEGGIVEGKLVSIEQVQTLANLPSKLELLAKMVGSMKAPISGFVNVMGGNLRGLVTVLEAIKNKK